MQTPTLALVCSRYLENRDFVPQTYHQLKVTTAKDGKAFAVFSEQRYDTQEEAKKVLATVTAAGTVSVDEVQRKDASQEPPLLYDLTALQKDANSRFGFSAERTLALAQSLYEKKVLSYPRTGSRFIPEDVFDEMPERIAALETHPVLAVQAARLKDAVLNRHSVNDRKVTDHHALILTECRPGELSEDERKVYDMVAARLLEAFSERCLKEVTTVSLTAGDCRFSVKGTQVKSAGWRAVRAEREEDEEEVALPVLLPGENLPVQTAESSLLSAMEHCGKEVQKEEYRSYLEEVGIGTPATRASIIETLIARGYMCREKRNLVPTEKGLAVYGIVKDRRIADVGMTGQWEAALAKIENGEMDSGTFRRGIEAYAVQITEELLQVQVPSAEGERIPCPKCRSGRILFYPKVAKCSNVDCPFTVFRDKGGKRLSDRQITDLVVKGKTELVKRFKSKEDKSFDARLVLDKDFRIGYEFPPRKDGKR